VVTAFASGLAAAYFLFAPRFSLYVVDPVHVAELATFMLVALATSKIIALLTFGGRRAAATARTQDRSLLLRGNSARSRTGVLLIHSVGGTPAELQTTAIGL